MWIYLKRPGRQCRNVFVLTGLILLVAQSCQAWSGAGHMVIAAGAYHELSSEARAKVDLILRSHPDYERWKESFAGETRGEELGLFVFMMASKWPDEIRRKNNNYDHPHWHYVNYALKPPGFKPEPRPEPQDDILFGIAEAEKVISDHSAAPEARAAYLSWLIHLIGDLHQPLHCAALVNATYPDGDKGGNDFYVRPASKGIRLHSFWDGLLGTRNQARPQVNYSAQLLVDYPKWRLIERRHKKLEEWSVESRTPAVKKVYLKGELKGSTSSEAAPTLPRNYAKAAKAVAERQAALASYRLAQEVTRCMK